jgi:hypothetical protein
MSFAITAIAAGAGYALAGSGSYCRRRLASIAGHRPQVEQDPNKLPPLNKPQAFSLKRPLKPRRYKRTRRPVRLRYKHSQPVKQAPIQERIAQEQIAQARRTFEEQKGFLQPYQEPGLNALARIQAGIAPGGEFARPFTMDQFQADPGYAFRLSEGQKALERQAAARGGLISGSALKAASRFGQEMGSQEFQNAFARAQTERANVLNPLACSLRHRR